MAPNDPGVHIFMKSPLLEHELHLATHFQQTIWENGGMSLLRLIYKKLGFCLKCALSLMLSLVDSEGSQLPYYELRYGEALWPTANKEVRPLVQQPVRNLTLPITM